MSELSADDKELEGKVEEEMEIEDSLLEPAIQLSTDDNGLEQNEQFFPFDNLSVEINEGEEGNKESSEQQSALFEQNSYNELAEDGQELSNLSNEVYNPSAVENAAADSTVPESNESSQDATFEEDAVIKSEPEEYAATNLTDYLFSETSMNYDEGSNSAAEETKEETKKYQLYRFPKIIRKEDEDPASRKRRLTKERTRRWRAKQSQESRAKIRSFQVASRQKRINQMTRLAAHRAAHASHQRKYIRRMKTVMKNVQMAEYETLQVLYQLLYQRSAWDTQEILKQRILEFSGFTFNNSSEEYFNRDMMLKTQPNDVLIKIGHVLGLDQIRNMFNGGDNARLDLISAIMQFLSTMKSLNVKSRKRGPHVKSGIVPLDASTKNLQTKCGCQNRCLAKVTRIQRVALLEYLKELEDKVLLDSYLFNLIDAKKNGSKLRPGEEKHKYREIKYTYKAKFGPKEFTVCKGGFAVYHGLKQSKLLQIQNSLKNETGIPPKIDMKDFPTFNVPESHRRSNTMMSDTTSTINYMNEESNPRRNSAVSEEDSKETLTSNKVVPKLIVEKLQTNDDETNKYKVVSFKCKSWEREDMFNAMTCVKQGDMGCGVASKKFNVPRSTLKRYMSNFYETNTSIDEFLDVKLGLSQHVQKSPKDKLSNNPQAPESEQEDDENSNEDKPAKEKGEKKKLKEFPLVVTAINNASKELLIDVHFLLFLESADDEEVKDNILNFSGFTFDKDTEEYDERNEFLQRMSFKIVSDVARSFSLEILNSKEDTIKNILAFLEQPAESYLRISSNIPLSLSDVELDDIEGFSDSDESITCEVVEKKVECIDLISSGEDSDDDKPKKEKSPKKAVSANQKPPSIPTSTPSLSTPSPSVPSQSTASVVTNFPETTPIESTDTDSSTPSQTKTRTLRNFETICKIVNTHPHEYLVDIFDLLYLRKHEPSTLRKDILDFSGFTFEKGSPEYVKRKQLLDRMLYNSVRRIYNTLIHNTTEVKVFSKPTMIAEIFQFLFKLPDHDTSVRPPPAAKPALKPSVVSNIGKSAPVGVAPPPGIPTVNQNGKLSDLKRVFQRVACFPCEYLVDVHKLLFMTDCDPKVIRQNIFAFKGFKFGPESQEFQQRKMYLEYLTFHSLRKISSVLTTRSVDLRNSTKHELATHLTQVLAEYCNTYSDTEVPEITAAISNATNQNTSAVTSTSESSKAVETIVVTPSLDPAHANPPAETSTPPSTSKTVQNKSPPKNQKQSPAKSKNATQPSDSSPLPISIVDTRSVPQTKRKRKSNTVSKKLNDKSQSEANQFADINLPEVEKYRQMYGQSIYNPSLPTITGITTFGANGIPQTFPIAQPMSFPIMQVQPSQVIGVPIISQVQGSEVIVPGENATDEDNPSKKQKVSEKSEKRSDANNDDEEDCDKPLASLIGHPIETFIMTENEGIDLNTTCELKWYCEEGVEIRSDMAETVFEIDKEDHKRELARIRVRRWRENLKNDPIKMEQKREQARKRSQRFRERRKHKIECSQELSVDKLTVVENEGNNLNTSEPERCDAEDESSQSDITDKTFEINYKIEREKELARQRSQRYRKNKKLDLQKLEHERELARKRVQKYRQRKINMKELQRRYSLRHRYKKKIDSINTDFNFIVPNPSIIDSPSENFPSVSIPDSVLNKNIADIVEQTNLQDITINKVIQKIYSMYPKFDLSYRKEFIKSTVRNLLYKLGEKNNSSAPSGDRNTNSPDCSVTTTDIQDNSMDQFSEASTECS